MADQGAGRNSGQAAGGGRFVKFSHGAAKRIANVVRIVEAGDRGQPPLRFDHPIPAGGEKLRVATFTGSWETGTWKTVTLTNSTQTANVYNWTTPVLVATGCSGSSRYVVFGRASGTNSLVEVQLHATCSTCVLSFGSIDLAALPGYDASQIQLIGHNTTGPCLEWYSVTTCATT